MKPIYGEEDVARMVKMYVEEKKSLREIADVMHVSSRTTVKRYLLDAGVTLRPRGSPIRPDGRGRNYHDAEADQIDTIEYLYWMLGRNTYEVAEALGIGQSAVVRRMQRHGVPRRSTTVGNVNRVFSEERREQLRKHAQKLHREGRLRRPDPKPDASEP